MYTHILLGSEITGRRISIARRRLNDAETRDFVARLCSLRSVNLFCGDMLCNHNAVVQARGAGASQTARISLGDFPLDVCTEGTPLSFEFSERGIEIVRGPNPGPVTDPLLYRQFCELFCGNVSVSFDFCSRLWAVLEERLKEKALQAGAKPGLRGLGLVDACFSDQEHQRKLNRQWLRDVGNQRDGVRRVFEGFWKVCQRGLDLHKSKTPARRALQMLGVVDLLLRELDGEEGLRPDLNNALAERTAKRLPVCTVQHWLTASEAKSGTLCFGANQLADVERVFGLSLAAFSGTFPVFRSDGLLLHRDAWFRRRGKGLGVSITARAVSGLQAGSCLWLSWIHPRRLEVHADAHVFAVSQELRSLDKVLRNPCLADYWSSGLQAGVLFETEVRQIAGVSMEEHGTSVIKAAVKAVGNSFVKGVDGQSLADDWGTLGCGVMEAYRNESAHNAAVKSRLFAQQVAGFYDLLLGLARPDQW